ncbi:protein translocase subunit SecD [Pacificispira sp.]|uniref:protein translocase subunit SecD n=1 Tax=Pacificispira sp. TaxID=2888761 RepID=UPI003B5294CB
MLQFPAWKKALIAILSLLGILYAAPNATGPWQFDGYPTWAPGKPMSLGLDLKGGAHILVEVETESVVWESMESTEESLRIGFREARIRTTNFTQNQQGLAITFGLRDAADLDAARQVISENAPEYDVELVGDKQFRLTLPESEVQAINQRTMSQSLEVVTRRVNALGLTEPTIQRQGQDRILIQVPGLSDTEQLKAILNAQAKLSFHLADFERMPSAVQSGRPPPGYILVPSQQKAADGSPAQMYLVTKQSYVSGENLDNAQATFQDGQPVVSFTFDASGGQRFGRVTQENVGGFLAIVLDDEVISAPQIRTAILGGSGVITGNFTLQGAQELSLLLRAGALPAKMDPVEERTVGPGLGQDSIDAGSLAAIVGLILVIVYMTASYGRFGVYANIALILNLILIIGILSALGATLTLPGIAGIVLTVGMAVDANVLIFERIREEAGLGRTVMNAVEAGYKRALTTIIDANLTTLIAAVLLFAFGAGPIRGFAITLAIGLVTSMFTAIMVTRFFVVNHVRAKRLSALPIAPRVVKAEEA